MSKTDSSLRLLAILRFAIPSKSSRTLNATQAYDVTSSGITLASATGTLLDRDVAVKGEYRYLGVGLTVSGMSGSSAMGTAMGEKQVAIEGGYIDGCTATLTAYTKQPRAREARDRAQTTYSFTGTAIYGIIPVSNKPKATNPNTFFYGAITVGTGDYKKWQGKYAVLKINTVTGKGVLRIYDDA